MGHRLETTSHIAVIVASLFLCVTLAHNYLNRPTPRAEMPPAYRIGEQFGPVDGVSFSDRERTLVLFVRSSCRYCTESLGFYRRLLEARRQRNPQLAILALTDEPLAVCKDYLRRNDVGVDRTVEVPRGSLKLRGTPAIVLVDRDGSVLQLWQGRLPADVEEEVIRTLG